MTRLGRLAELLIRLRLGDVAFRAFQRLQAWSWRGPEPDDPLLPPPYLRVLTAGHPEPHAFVALGRQAADEFMALATRHGGAPGGDDAVLEFGCGCGRVARHVAPQTPAFFGCDVARRLVAWCRAHLPGDYRVTGREPPLPYETAAFSLIYSLSVFTHMHEPQARAWLAELGRVTRPNGLALLSFHDDRSKRTPALQLRLNEEGFAVLYEGSEGSNLLSGYFTPAGFAARAAPDWEMVDYVPSDASVTGQAIAVLRRV